MVRKRLTGLVALLLPFVFMQAHLAARRTLTTRSVRRWNVLFPHYPILLMNR